LKTSDICRLDEMPINYKLWCEGPRCVAAPERAPHALQPKSGTVLRTCRVSERWYQIAREAQSLTTRYLITWVLVTNGFFECRVTFRLHSGVSTAPVKQESAHTAIIRRWLLQSLALNNKNILSRSGMRSQDQDCLETENCDLDLGFGLEERGLGLDLAFWPRDARSASACFFSIIFGASAAFPSLQLCTVKTAGWRLYIRAVCPRYK